ncbi:MAG: phytanoyl-CoA dioxygenase family protein [Chloroflexota bacterium]
MIDEATMMKQVKDDGLATDYPDWLYDFAAEACEGVQGLENVEAADIALFHERGYLVVHDAFSREEVENGRSGLVDLINGAAPDFKRIQYENVMAEQLATLTNETRQDAVRKLFYFVEYDERCRSLAYHPALLSVVRQLIGESEIDMFQDMALIKPPRIGREKPWHQDMAYFNLPLSATVVGVWIALDEATPENGCMMVIPGSHKQGAMLHFKRRDWQLCDTDVMNDGAVAVPLRPGSCLLFHGLIHHGTPANRSEKRRRAMQFHYRASSVVEKDEAHRLAHFGSDGTGATC